MKKIFIALSLIFLFGCSNAENFSGSVEVDGSSTVYPLVEAVAEEFNKVHPQVKTPIGISGTGGGFKRFCIGETDISNASRTIKESEVQLCKDNNIEFVELAVTYDGLTVVINKDNTWATSMTVEQLKQLYEPNSSVTKWNQLDPAWPDKEIKIYSPGADSGTFDYFTEEIVGEAKASRNDSQIMFSEDDNVLVQGVSSDLYAIAYFGFSYYEENINVLNAVKIDGVSPTFETISSGEYKPLSRELFIYVNKASLRDKVQVKEFVEFFINNVKNVANEVGFVPLNDSLYSEQLKKIQ